MAGLDSQGEIVPIELQIQKNYTDMGENKLVHSR